MADRDPQRVAVDLHRELPARAGRTPRRHAVTVPRRPVRWRKVPLSGVFLACYALFSSVVSASGSMWSGPRADLGRDLPRLLRLLHLLLGDALALLGLLRVCVRLLPELLCLFAPLCLLAVAPCAEDDEPENHQRTDRDQDPDPSCHYSLLVFPRQTGGVPIRFRLGHRQDAAAHLAEPDAVGGAAVEDDLVAVFEEAFAAEELGHRSLRARLGARDRARRHQVSRA